ncbi:MAG: hypothetical protein EOP49_08560 [Sphingobacteriales bacterium]|nr:MAG: hypothetical protein EOP49_08560 [Sphingobacteriales bacterium]
MKSLKKITMIVLLLLLPIIDGAKFHGHVTSFHPKWADLGDKVWLLLLVLLIGALIILGEFRKTIWGKITLLVSPLLLIAGFALWANLHEYGPGVFCLGMALGSLLYSIYFFRKTGITVLAVMKYVFVIVSAITYTSIFYPTMYNYTFSWVEFVYTQLLLVVFCVYHLQGGDHQGGPNAPEVSEGGTQVFRYEE